MSSLNRNIRQSFVAVLLLVGAAIYALMGIAHPPEGTTITNEAISSFLFKTGQRMVVRSNTTETVVQSTSLATILELNLSVRAMVGNGQDSCRVRATVLDAAGAPVPDGQPVEFVTTAGLFSNGNDTTYTLTVNGTAVTWLRSEMLTSSQPITARVTASTLGASGQSLTQFLPMVFYAGAVRGKILSGQGRSVAGMIVVAYTPTREEAGRDTTASDGEFIIPVVRSDLYTIAFRYKTAFTDDITVSMSAAVTVPASGGVAAVAPLNTIVGNVVDMTSGAPIRQSRLPVMLYRTSTNPTTGGRILPALQLTDERGVFAFDSLAAGSYEALVMDVRYAGKSVIQQSELGTVIIDADIQLADAPSLGVIKTSNKRIAEIGDAVTYTIEVRNISASAPLTRVRLIDELPHAFVFAENSARRDSVPLVNPDDKRRLEWMLADSLLPGRSMRVTYSALVGAGALDGNGVNTAIAFATNAAGQTVQSLQASIQVTVRPGVFSDRGVVIGKVFYDENENAEQDDGESGIRGVELWMEDGSRIITGDDGKYSLPEVRAAQHVMRVNTLTLPYGAELLALKSESAGDGLSRFVRLTEGGIARTDFYVRRPRQASATAMYATMYAAKAGERIPALYALRFDDIGTPTRIQLADTLPPGFTYDYKSIAWRGMPLYPDGIASPTLTIEFPKRNENSTDTVHFVIVADSAAIGKPIASTGRLLLSYPRGRDASFAIAQAYNSVEPPASEPIIAAEPKDTAKVVIEPTPQDTVVKQAETLALPKRLVAKRRKVEPKQFVHVDSTRVDSIKVPALDSVKVLEHPKVETTKKQKRSRIAELLGYDEGKRFYEQTELFVRAGGLIASGVVLYLLLLLLWKRRKRKEEEER
jgi:uncharacterized repeat protein (TIGR01451 family)